MATDKYAAEYEQMRLVWFGRALGRFLLCFLAVPVALAPVLPAMPYQPSDQDYSYLDGVLWAPLLTWLMFLVVGIWYLLVLVAAAVLHRNTDSFMLRGAVVMGLPLSLVLLVPLAGIVVGLTHLLTCIVFSVKFMPPGRRAEEPEAA
ncbi:hypothetical protein [Streptomyces sp. TBY4]|uniref:hypothetical protein n=1 Tax=Streptomyces sp. TBY4 TaxID=2962030 RepID=UPI0020B7455A|nr:hypothetical protein [Streptomyces sp. TBY4]MCP3759990.1 hypothetical protein [Streptomyces sp. TBY4]